MFLSVKGSEEKKTSLKQASIMDKSRVAVYLRINNHAKCFKGHVSLGQACGNCAIACNFNGFLMSPCYDYIDD